MGACIVGISAIGAVAATGPLGVAGIVVGAAAIGGAVGIHKATEGIQEATKAKLLEFKAELEKETGSNAKEIAGLLAIINKCSAV